jgi:ABC-type transport system involved in cytochrome bd biosynthesis fused ATPase/permease subunit
VAQAVVLADVIVAIFLRGDDVADVLPRLLLLAGVGCCRALLAAVQELVAGRVSTRVRTELRAIGLHAVRQLGPGRAQQQPAGRLVTAVGPGLELLDGYLTRALPALTAACAVPPIVLIAIGVADWQSAVILILALPLVPLLMALIGVTTPTPDGAAICGTGRHGGTFSRSAAWANHASGLRTGAAAD